MKSGGLLEAVVELSQERGLDQDAIIEAIEDAIVGAAYRKYKQYKNIEAVLNRHTGEIELMHYRVVVEEITDSDNQILLDDVLKLDPLAECGDEVEYEIDSKEFAGVIAQTARQLIFQKIREAEREAVLEKYKDKVGEVVHGTVARVERGRVILMISNTVEAVLDRREQIPFEKLQPGDHTRALLIDVRSEGRGPQLVISRSHPRFLVKLLEVEVPEVFDGVIDVISASREPGKRAKVAVRGNDMDVDPVGSCVGVRGSRIQTIVSELCGERIDVVEWSANLETFIANAIAPAEILEISLDTEKGTADVKVAADQLSLAIGKQGQNVRLASRLTDVSINVSPWSIPDLEDIKSMEDEKERLRQEEEAAAAEAANAKTEKTDEDSIGNIADEDSIGNVAPEVDEDSIGNVVPEVDEDSIGNVVTDEPVGNVAQEVDEDAIGNVVDDSIGNVVPEVDEDSIGNVATDELVGNVAQEIDEDAIGNVVDDSIGNVVDE